MFQKILKTSLEAGADVIVETKFSCESFQGRVLELTEKSFTLFHSGTGGGILWAFHIKDLSCCGLVIEGLKESMASLNLMPDNKYPLQHMAENIKHCPLQDRENEFN